MGIDAWARVDVTTLNKHIKRLSDLTDRKRVFLNTLKKRGSVLMNQHGKKFDWRVMMELPDVDAYDDMEAVNIMRRNPYRELELPYRALSAGESISKFEKLANGSGPEALIKIISKITPNLTKAVTNALASGLYNDADSTSNDSDRKMHGLETVFSDISSVVTNSKAGDPSGTYAGINMALGTYNNSSWTAETSDGWPTGTGDEAYCALSPLLVDVTNSGWTANTKTWPNTWRQCIRYGQTYMEVLHNEQIDTIILAPTYWREALDSMDDNERIIVTRNAENMSLTKLGHEAINFEGTELTKEYGVPDKCGYGVIWDKLTLRSMQGQLIGIDKDRDITTKTDRFTVDFFGNLQIESPCYCFKLEEIS